jgi:hypothetical protein
MRDNLTEYQDMVIFALGRLGAMGCLTGVPAAEPFLHVWMVQLIMGHIYDRYTSEDIGPTSLSEPLKSEVRQRLLHDFGLTPQEQERAMRLYRWTKVGVVVLHHLDAHHFPKRES